MVYAERIFFVAVSASTWYDARLLMQTMMAIRKINFNITEQRTQALQRLNSCQCQVPFAVNERFPEDRFYICEAWGDWGRKFQQLRLALSSKGREKDSSLREGAKPVDLSDAIVAFSNATQGVIEQITQGDGVVDRNVFEDVWHLEWE